MRPSGFAIAIQVADRTLTHKLCTEALADSLTAVRLSFRPGIYSLTMDGAALGKPCKDFLVMHLHHPDSGYSAVTPPKDCSRWCEHPKMGFLLPFPVMTLEVFICSECVPDGLAGSFQ